MDDRLHKCDRTPLLRVAVRTVKYECRTQIVKYQRDVAREIERLEPGIEIGCVINEAIGRRRRGAGLAHAHEIGREAAAEVADVRNDVAPKIRPCRIAMEKND